MDLFVDLPAKQKGSHMSRNLELVSEIIDMNMLKPVPDLETFCAETAKLLLKKHDYATYSEIKNAHRIAVRTLCAFSLVCDDKAVSTQAITYKM